MLTWTGGAYARCIAAATPFGILASLLLCREEVLGSGGARYINTWSLMVIISLASHLPLGAQAWRVSTPRIESGYRYHIEIDIDIDIVMC